MSFFVDRSRSVTMIEILILVSTLAGWSPVHIGSAEASKYAYPDVFNDPDRDTPIYGKFPNGFAWGSVTTAYQVEGGWDADGKGVSIWDTFSQSGRCGGQTGNVACDSYNKYTEDVKMLKALGLTHYSFTISWSRVMPDGTRASLNEAGLAFYEALTDELLKVGIEPVVTLSHWDLPQALQDKYGGWVNDSLVALFNDYADVCFERLGAKVNLWITFAKPFIACWFGYGVNVFAPGVYRPGYGPYRAAHTIIKSHAMAYNTYQQKYKAQYNGQVSITLSTDFCHPEDEDNPAHVAAADRHMQFTLGWFAHPIFKNGDYPDVMKWQVGNKSLAQGLNESRLPVFTDEEKQSIAGTGDFFSLNTYTTSVCKDNFRPTEPSYQDDQDVSRYHPEEWPMSGSYWLRPVPWGLRRLLNWVETEYGKPIYITQNGVSTADVADLDDSSRIAFYKSHINEVLKAINLDGVNVKAYFAFSLMDSFEWTSGYTQRFGLFYVNFTDPDRPRTPKESATLYARLVADNGFAEEPNPNGASEVASSYLVILVLLVFHLVQ